MKSEKYIWMKGKENNVSLKQICSIEKLSKFRLKTKI